MSREPASAPAPGFRALWRARPPHYPRALWALLLGLDLLPWPYGEDILRRLFVIKAIWQIRVLRRALRWSSCQPGQPRRLALALCAFRGLTVARSTLLGIRRPEDLRRLVSVKGQEHLGKAAGRPTILLGFHLGPPCADQALRMAGHALTRLGGGRLSRAWLGQSWAPYRDAGQILLPVDDPGAWPRALHEARRTLLDGGTLFIHGDGHGRAAFSIPLPGGPLLIRSGWLALRRHTGATVLPVLTHLEGRRQVITVHPPLPPRDPDPQRDLEACRAVLSRLLLEYLRRFPEQCWSLAFWPEEAAWLGSEVDDPHARPAVSLLEERAR
jgi:lauroyl/myristoyl acyltransferase